MADGTFQVRDKNPDGTFDETWVDAKFLMYNGQPVVNTNTVEAQAYDIKTPDGTIVNGAT